MQIDDIIWCASLFDDKGHVSYYRQEPRNPVTGKMSPQLQCYVYQSTSNIEILEKFQHIIGFGHLMGPYDIKGTELIYRVTFKINEVEPLFNLLRPHLGEKKTADFNLALTNHLYHDPEIKSEDTIKAHKRYERKKSMKIEHSDSCELYNGGECTCGAMR